MITAEDLKQFGKVEKCGVFDGKFHVLITEGFNINACNTFSLMQKIVNNVGGEYPIVDKCITDDNLFDFILKRREKCTTAK